MDRWLIFAFLLCVAVVGVFFIIPHGTGETGTNETVRIGFFPNLLHGQALVGDERGTFRDVFGPNVTVEMVPFNAGPSVIEALFADQVDIAYIGPNPAINGYIKSEGKALRIISGAASGGAVFVVRNDSGITKPADLIGKRIASPQLGNTQDVALRDYIIHNGMEIGDGADQVRVIPTANPDILTLFQKKELDAAWVPEPWGARLVDEGNGTIFVDERDLWPNGSFVTANIIVSTKFMQAHPDLVKRFLEAHVDLTLWINEHPDEAKALMNAKIKNVTSKELPKQELDEAFSRCGMTYDPLESSLYKSADGAYELGFLGDTKPNLSGIYDLSTLNEVLAAKGLEKIG